MTEETMGFWDAVASAGQSATRYRQTTIPTPHHSIFTCRMLFLTPNQPNKGLKGQSKDWRQKKEVTHTHPFNGPFSGTTRVTSTRKIKPIWISLKQRTVRGSGISWAMYKSAPRSRQITMPAPHHSVFYRPDALPATQPTASKHWMQAGC